MKASSSEISLSKISGSEITPIREDATSPIDQVIASPGILDSPQTLRGPPFYENTLPPHS